jgi:hypothetical protein
MRKGFFRIHIVDLLSKVCENKFADHTAMFWGEYSDILRKTAGMVGISILKTAAHCKEGI